MEKTIEKAQLIVNENEKLIANILHDIKSPLYSIKIGLQNNLNNELNKDIFETTLDIIKYIENFLINYSFKEGKFESKIDSCNIKKIIEQKIENYKYIFINKNITIDFLLDENDYMINSIEIFISSIIGNIISNMAFHASKNENAIIELYKKNNCVIAEFKNYYNDKTDNFNLGLNFCKKLAILTKIDLKFTKTKDVVCVKLKIPSLKNLKNLKGQVINI